MNKIRVIGQAITSTNYATERLFNFNPGPVREAAENFLASGITEVEIPEAVLDPEKRFPDTGVDRETLQKTIDGMPRQTRVIGTYFGPPAQNDVAAYIETTKRKIDNLLSYFPDIIYGMLHPPGWAKDQAGVRTVVEAWAACAAYAAQQKTDFQLCLHNHYDSSCETAEQVRTYLDEIERAAEPALRWGPDTGHCHGMNDDFLDILKEKAALIGNHFHIKARIPAFDKKHGGELYRPDRDIWGNAAEKGRGLYSGFVNVADPEIETPLHEVFSIIRQYARPTAETITGAVEIDNPRQHPRLEALCSTLYLKSVHGIETAEALSCEELVNRVFRG